MSDTYIVYRYSKYLGVLLYIISLDNKLFRAISVYNIYMS